MEKLLIINIDIYFQNNLRICRFTCLLILLVASQNGLQFKFLSKKTESTCTVIINATTDIWLIDLSKDFHLELGHPVQSRQATGSSPIRPQRPGSLYPFYGTTDLCSDVWVDVRHQRQVLARSAGGHGQQCHRLVGDWNINFDADSVHCQRSNLTAVHGHGGFFRLQVCGVSSPWLFRTLWKWHIF